MSAVVSRLCVKQPASPPANTATEIAYRTTFTHNGNAVCLAAATPERKYITHMI